MNRPTDAELDVIIDRYWPRTRSRVSLYKMINEAIDLAAKPKPPDPIWRLHLSPHMADD